MSSDTLYTHTSYKLGQTVSTPYGQAEIIDFQQRYASLGAQELTPHVKVRTPSGSIHWFEVGLVNNHYNTIR